MKYKIGGISESIAPVQNIFKSSILSNAAGIMLLHTHPSGNAEPSRQDLEITKKLVQAGKLMEIPLVDHVIIGCGTGNLYSFHSEDPEMFSGPYDSKYIDGILKNGQKPKTRNER